MKAVNDLDISDCDFVLELSFREREPADSSVESALTQSVDYWRPFISN